MIKKFFTKEIKVRIGIASYLLQLSEDQKVEFISRFQCDKEREKTVLIEKVQQLMIRGIEAASFACTNLVQSRTSNYQKTDLTFGVGFKGWLFSSATGIKSLEQKIYLNLSESGRSLPNTKNLFRSLFSLPFLYATKYLMEEKHLASSPTDNQSIKALAGSAVESLTTDPKDVIKVLTKPTEKDKEIHLYLFQRILYHYFVNDRIKVYSGFYSAIKEELIRCIQAEMTVQVAKQEKKLDELNERLKNRKINSQVKNKLKSEIKTAETEIEKIQGFCDSLSEKIQKHQKRPLLSEEEFVFVLSALNNKSAICVEAVISKHSKNNLIIPLSFDQKRSDIVKVRGKELRIGRHQRPVIPPCDKYCQLFSGSHILWAELTRERTLAGVYRIS